MTTDNWARAAAAYESTSYVDRPQVEAMIRDLLKTLPDMQAAAVFTDDYAPIETMSF
jgi:hypothetical protein